MIRCCSPLASASGSSSFTNRWDPGGRGWHVRVPAGATWLSLRDDEGHPARGAGPEPTFGFGEPPVGEGAWEKPGY